MTTSTPEVSIIIPTKDRAAWLARTLLSAWAQNAVDYEVIVVDDGSHTPVGELLAEGPARQVTLLRNERSQGVAAARNRGIRAARSPWLAFLDDDDVWAPNKLRRQLAVAADADYVFANGMTVDRSGQVLSHDEVPRSDTDLRAAMLAANRVPCGCSNLIAKTSLVRSVKGFDPNFAALADWDLNIRLSTAGRGAVTGESLVAYTLHGSNMHRDEAALTHELRRLAGKYAPARAACRVDIDYRWWLTWRASTHRAAGNSRAAAQAYWLLGRRHREPGAILRAVALGAGAEPLLATGRRLRSMTALAPPPKAPPAWLHHAVNPSPRALRSVYRLEQSAPIGFCAQHGL
jgi:glycosyltransferase involved in cell wall biosynthesis